MWLSLGPEVPCVLGLFISTSNQGESGGDRCGEGPRVGVGGQREEAGGGERRKNGVVPHMEQSCGSLWWISPCLSRVPRQFVALLFSCHALWEEELAIVTLLYPPLCRQCPGGRTAARPVSVTSAHSQACAAPLLTQRPQP